MKNSSSCTIKSWFRRRGKLRIETWVLPTFNGQVEENELAKTQEYWDKAGESREYSYQAIDSCEREVVGDFPGGSLLRICLPMQGMRVWSLVGEILGFPDSSVGKESSCNTGDPGSIPGLGRSPGEGKGYPLQYSGLENSMDCTHKESAPTEWLSLSLLGKY